MSFKTAWETSALSQVCTVEQVEQAAMQAHQELYSNEELGRNQEEADIGKFWRQRPDRMAINHDKRIIYIIELKRTLDLRPSFQAKAEDRANQQSRLGPRFWPAIHEWLAQTLTKVGTRSDWKVQMIVFTGGTMGSVKIERFEHNLKALDVKKKAWTHMRKLHARALLEAHDAVLRAYYETLYASLYIVKPRKHIIDTMSHRILCVGETAGGLRT